MNKFLGEVKNGKMFLYNSANYENCLLKMDGKKIILSLEIKRKKRSTGKLTDKGNQNGYLFGVMIPIISDFTGYEHEEVKLALEVKFLRIGGTDDFPKVKPFKTLNTLEWEEVMERIRIYFLTEHNVKIPSVEEYYNLDNK